MRLNLSPHATDLLTRAPVHRDESPSWATCLQMRLRRRPRPGVTAAATTAVFATGDGPGDTAFATTAVFATGWPITPTLPTRAALSGISVSLACGCDDFVGFDRGDDRLDGDSSVRDQLTA